MTALFQKILEMSLNASWMIAAVLLLRFFLKRTPRKYTGILWTFVKGSPCFCRRVGQQIHPTDLMLRAMGFDIPIIGAAQRIVGHGKEIGRAHV